ncbi:MAG: zinc-dependent peptidase [Flavobacteriaceae bacterium]|nr:zinc-dependent peptidase [Flavobacteriaceae bacterium]
MLLISTIEKFTLGNKILLAIFAIAFAMIFIYYGIRTIEIAYVMRKKKPLFIHKYLFLRKLTQKQQFILRQRFFFYSKLTKQQQSYFEHRVASFIKDKDFIGRDGLVITEEIKVLISSTAVMLTFGFRDFYIGLINKIFIYPETFFSVTNKNYHKGEFNPRFRAIVLSWEDFTEGYKISDDNLNLGIHEFAHAIHLNTRKEHDVSSNIFQDSFNELINLLTGNDLLKQKLITSRYFRDYAYSNQYEFIAVIIETFIETPQEFRAQFPNVYSKVKQMLNFNFAGY